MVCISFFSLHYLLKLFISYKLQKHSYQNVGKTHVRIAKEKKHLTTGLPASEELRFKRSQSSHVIWAATLFPHPHQNHCWEVILNFTAITFHILFSSPMFSLPPKRAKENFMVLLTIVKFMTLRIQMVMAKFTSIKIIRSRTKKYRHLFRQP